MIKTLLNKLKFKQIFIKMFETNIKLQKLIQPF